MTVLLTLLAISIAIAIGAWLINRPRGLLFPSDVFFILNLLIGGTVPFFNLYAVSPLFVSFQYDVSAVQKAIISLTVMYLCFALVWMLRPKLQLASHTLTPQGYDRSLIWFFALAFLAVSIFPYASSSYLEYKSEVLRFYTADISAAEYRESRRARFVGDPASEIIGRLRYSLLPLLYLALSYIAIRKAGLVAGLAIATLAFILGPASLSKLPTFFFLLYVLIVYIIWKKIYWALEFKNSIISIFISIIIVFIGLSFVYLLQYGGSGIDLLRAMEISYYRLFVATYDSLLKWFTVFDGGEVGIGAISVLAPIFGENSRNVDLEVAVYLLGAQHGAYTSFPTIFIGQAYAVLGYIGVIVFSVLVAASLLLVDKGLTMVRNDTLRMFYYAIMMVNVLFFNLVAAQTALLTYGVATIPLIILGADRILRPNKVNR